MKIPHWFTLGCAALLLSGCATTQTQPITADQKSKISKLAVSSSLGNEFSFSFLGPTVDTNKRGASDVSNWKLDEKIIDHTKQSLSKSGITTVENISSASSSPEVLLKRAEETGFDTLLVFEPRPRSYIPGKVNSFGYYRERRAFIKTNCLFASMNASIYDVKSKQPLSTTSTYTWGVDGPCVDRDPIQDPLKEAFESIETETKFIYQIKTSLSEYSEADQQLFKESTHKLLNEAVEVTLDKFGLYQNEKQKIFE